MKRRRLSMEALGNRELLTSLVDTPVVEDPSVRSSTIVTEQVDPTADDGPT